MLHHAGKWRSPNYRKALLNTRHTNIILCPIVVRCYVVCVYVGSYVCVCVCVCVHDMRSRPSPPITPPYWWTTPLLWVPTPPHPLFSPQLCCRDISPLILLDHFWAGSSEIGNRYNINIFGWISRKIFYLDFFYMTN